MMLLALGAFFIGSLFGMSFRVWILIPAILTMMCLTGVHGAPDMPSVLISGMVSSLSLQGGYLIGLCANRFFGVAQSFETKRAAEARR
jgi:hypothetical protein